MSLQESQPESPVTLSSPQAPGSSQPKPGSSQPEPTSAQPPAPPAQPSPRPDPLEISLGLHFQNLVSLLRRKIAQSPAVYHHSASNDRILHHNIRREMRSIIRHPYFPDIENDMSEQDFHVGWGRLEAESVKWTVRDKRADWGRIMREQRAIEELLEEWGVDVGNRLERWEKLEKKEKGRWFGVVNFLRRKLKRRRRE